MKDLTSEERALLILATIKRQSDGWFPTLDEELQVLQKLGVSDW
jgi:hypothetical protein